jgi:hypothetical protein
MLCELVGRYMYSELSIIWGNGGGKVMDNPKPWLKQKQLGTKWI